MGNRQGAIEAVQRGIDAVMGRCSILNFRAGALLLEEGELDGAIESLKEAVDIDPKNADALGLLQWTLRTREEHLNGIGQEDAEVGGEDVATILQSAVDGAGQDFSEQVGDAKGLPLDGHEDTPGGGVDSKEELASDSGINAYSILRSLRSSLAQPSTEKKGRRHSMFS